MDQGEDTDATNPRADRPHSHETRRTMSRQNKRLDAARILPSMSNQWKERMGHHRTQATMEKARACLVAQDPNGNVCQIHISVAIAIHPMGRSNDSPVARNRANSSRFEGDDTYDSHVASKFPRVSDHVGRNTTIEYPSHSTPLPSPCVPIGNYFLLTTKFPLPTNGKGTRCTVTHLSFRFSHASTLDCLVVSRPTHTFLLLRTPSSTSTSSFLHSPRSSSSSIFGRAQLSRRVPVDPSFRGIRGPDFPSQRIRWSGHLDPPPQSLSFPLRPQDSVPETD